MNFDSVQIYEEIEIATANQVRRKTRRSAPLIDFVDPRINYTAADWADDARKRSRRSKPAARRPFWLAGQDFICGRCDSRCLKAQKRTNNCGRDFKDQRKRVARSTFTGCCPASTPMQPSGSATRLSACNAGARGLFSDR